MNGFYVVKKTSSLIRQTLRSGVCNMVDGCASKLNAELSFQSGRERGPALIYLTSDHSI